MGPETHVVTNVPPRPGRSSCHIRRDFLHMGFPGALVAFKGHTPECMYFGVGISVSYSLGHTALTMVDPHFLHETSPGARNPYKDFKEGFCLFV